MYLSDGFKEMMRGLLKDEADNFFAAMGRPAEVSVRLNSRKPGADFPESDPVAWCPQGRYLPSRPVFTLDPLLHAGAYYVQDASSMIYYEVAKRIAAILTGSSEGVSEAAPYTLSLLDLCAAPGGKTTAMIDALPNGTRVTANEYVGKRAAILKENIIKWGYPFVTVTNRDSSFFSTGDFAFDIVAVDAPCSGEGMMRKDEDACRQWSHTLISECAALQREIVSNAVKALKPGGFLVYSTCTFNRQENEENAEYFSETLGLRPVDLGFPEEWGIAGGIDTDLPVCRFMPHKTRGEGLFLAVFQKPGNWQPSGVAERSLRHASRKSFPGSPDTATRKKSAGKPKSIHTKPINAEETPDIEEILSIDFDCSRFPTAELSKDMALSYLRREAITLPPGSPKGLTVVTYKGLPLGMAKNVGTRANNLYPKNWRILMR